MRGEGSSLGEGVGRAEKGGRESNAGTGAQWPLGSLSRGSKQVMVEAGGPQGF